MRNERASRARKGLTRIEVTIGLCLSGLAMGALMPCFQAARADAERARCQENMRELGSVFHEFEKAGGGFPPRRTSFQTGNKARWGPFLLPYIGESELAQKYNFKLDCYDPGNKPRGGNAGANVSMPSFARESDAWNPVPSQRKVG